MQEQKAWVKCRGQAENDRELERLAQTLCGQIPPSSHRTKISGGIMERFPLGSNIL